MSFDHGRSRRATRANADQPVHELDDARAMRAMAHPIRLALLEALGLEGELTATEAGERIGESPASCSFHLRQLAKYGFVEEAGRGAGRRRPWRRRYVSLHFDLLHEDRETTAAAEALSDVLRGRYLERIRRAVARRHLQPPEWLAVTGESEFLLHVTPDELRALDAEITATLRRYADRVSDPASRPAGARPIEVLLFAHPADS